MYYILLLLTVLIILSSCRIIGGGYNEDYLSLEITKNEKGIAAILILLHHLSQRVKVSGPFLIMSYIGFILVAIFFFISGYGLSYGMRNKSNYLEGFFRKRLFPVLVPYWIINTIDIIFYLSKGKIFIPMQYILSYIGADIITGTWFVTTILILYLIFWIAFKCKKSYTILTICLIGYCTICIYFKLHTSYTASVAAFLLGVIWNKIDKRVIIWIREKYYFKLAIVFGTFGILFLGRLLLSAKGLDNEIIQLILRNLVSVLFVLSQITVTQKIQYTGKMLNWLGNISYELYIVHYVLLTMLSGLTPNVYLVAVFGGGILFSTLLWMVDKKLGA